MSRRRDGRKVAFGRWYQFFGWPLSDFPTRVNRAAPG
jgi:hypothetical protein